VVTFGPEPKGCKRVIWAGRHKSGERGANLVEFAILAPLLILLLFGIIEFAWVFGQNLNVRHGAREGARLAAVDFTPLVSGTCGRMDIVSGATFGLLGTDLNGNGVDVGDEVAVTISAPVNTITGLFDTWLPATLTSTVSIRIEQTPSWSNGTTSCP
jgi:Flp pilus assembly protein TadG